MNNKDTVAVCSRSFSNNKILREELKSKYKNVKFNDQGLVFDKESLINFLQGSTKAIVGLEIIDYDVLSKLPNLKLISKYGVGLDMIDLEALKKLNVQLGWTGGVNRRSVSEMVIAIAVSLLREIPQSNKDIHNRIWKQRVGGLLSEKKIGVIGCGHIGKDLISLLQPWGCAFQVYDIASYPDFYKKYNVHPVDLDTLLKTSDIVTLHVPLDETTQNILSYEKLEMLKEGAIIINLARGGLVDEDALKKFLMSGRIFAAAFDVFANEPPQDFELINLENFLSTSHIGGSAREAILAMGRSAIKNLEIK